VIYNRQVHKHQLFMTVVDKQNPERHFTDDSFAQYGIDEDDTDSDSEDDPAVSSSQDEAGIGSAAVPGLGESTDGGAVAGSRARLHAGGRMIQDNAELKDDPILMQIAENQSLTKMIRKVRGCTRLHTLP
jgi:hypothetical protein